MEYFCHNKMNSNTGCIDFMSPVLFQMDLQVWSGGGKKKKKKKTQFCSLNLPDQPIPLLSTNGEKIWINTQTGLKNLISSVGCSISSCMI